MRQTVKFIIKRALPHKSYRALVRLKNGSQPETPSRQQDLSVFEIQEGVELRVYWAVRVSGKGPVMDVSVLDERILRFDCFGEGLGHYHMNLGKAFATKHNRLFFRERSIEEQIDRSLFEVRTNLPYYLERHDAVRIRRMIIDPVRLDNALFRVREKMMADIAQRIR